MSSKKGLTKQQKKFFPMLQGMVAETKQDRRSETYGSEKYWQISKCIIDSQRHLDTMRWTRMKAGFSKPNSTAYHDAEKDYLHKCAKLKKKYASIRRKEIRHRKRAAVLSLSKTDNLKSLRAAYVEVLMARFPKISRVDQRRLANDLTHTYGERTIAGCCEQVWSPVIPGWMNKEDTKVAHIVPLSIGQESMTYIFGRDAKEEMNTARNGLWLPKNVQDKFNQLELVIVPVDTTEEPLEWKMLVVGKDEIWNETAYWIVKFSELHERRLVFQSSAQPRARYLYFHFLCAMLHHSRTMNVTAADMSELSRAWGSEGSYLRKNVILGFAEQLRHAIPSEAVEEIRRKRSKGIKKDEAEQVATTVEYLDLDSEDGEDEEDSEDE